MNIFILLVSLFVAKTIAQNCLATERCCDFVASYKSQLETTKTEITNVGCENIEGITVSASVSERVRIPVSKFDRHDAIFTFDGVSGIGVDKTYGKGKDHDQVNLMDATSEELYITFSKTVRVKKIKLSGFNRRAVDTTPGTYTFSGKKITNKFIVNHAVIRCFVEGYQHFHQQPLQILDVLGEIDDNTVDLSGFGAVDTCHIGFHSGPGFAVSSITFDHNVFKAHSKENFEHDLKAYLAEQRDSSSSSSSSSQ